MLDTLLPQLAGFEILDSDQPRSNLSFLRVPKAQLFSLLGQLKQGHDFTALMTITCTDWQEEGVFRLGYLLEDTPRRRIVNVQTHIDREGEGIETCMGLWPQAEVLERELNEMFGIPIHDHPSLGDFMLEGWAHTPPMRREFDTLQFVNETFEMRTGREDAKDVREEIRKRKAEKKAAKAKQQAEGSKTDGSSSTEGTTDG